MLVFVLLGRYSWKPSKKFIIWQKLWMLQKSRSCLLPWSIYNLSKYSQYSAEFQCCLLYTNIATSTVFYLTLPYMIVLPTSLIVMRNKPSKGLRMSRFWISNPVVSRIEEEAMSQSGFHYCICTFILCRCRSFNPSLGRLSPFLLPYFAVSRPCLACRNLA